MSKPIFEPGDFPECEQIDSDGDLARSVILRAEAKLASLGIDAHTSAKLEAMQKTIDDLHHALRQKNCKRWNFYTEKTEDCCKRLSNLERQLVSLRAEIQEAPVVYFNLLTRKENQNGSVERQSDHTHMARLVNIEELPEKKK